MHEQAMTISHTSNVYHNEWAPRLAELLVRLTATEGGLGFSRGGRNESPTSAKVFFSNSGTEANEGALKIARKVGKDRWEAGNGSCTKTRITSFLGSFHGRSMGALSVTNNPKYQDPFAPLIPGIDVGTLNDYACLETAINKDTCGVIVEPIQGEGGINTSETEWLVALRKRCDEVGAVLIYDEIQVSF
jgi:acetylornithine aminotransferase